MMEKKLKREMLVALTDQLIRQTTVYGPKAVGDRFNYDKLNSAKELRMDFDVTLQSPKKYFQPPCETLLNFDSNGDYKPVFDDKPFVVFGVHPYDVAALSQMDDLFRQDNYDSHYMKRRNNATIVACDVVKPSANVFASCMNTATATEGYDLLLTDIGNGFVAKAVTEKGENILKMATYALEVTQDDLKKRQQVWDYNNNHLDKHKLKCSSTWLPRLLERAYDHPVWEELAKKCFACGSCNQVCPTCYCFNVQDDVNWDLQSGKRDRAWDGCLLDGFTKVAGDHEFRKNKAARIRHRIYRKGKYVPAKIGGRIACVGCGRCASACLTNIANPVNIYNRLVDDLGIG